MTGYDVNRGVGRVPEIFGITEKYLVYLLGAVVLAFVGFALLRMFGFGSIVSAIGLFAFLGGGVYAVQYVSLKYGEHGATKISAYRKRPRILRSSSRRPYLGLRR